MTRPTVRVSGRRPLGIFAAALIALVLAVPPVLLAAAPAAGPREIDALLTQLGGKDAQARVRAADSLARIKDPAATRGLIGLLRSDDAVVRFLAVQVLGELRDPKSIEALNLAMGDTNANTGKAAMGVLQMFGKKAEPVLLRSLNDDNPKISWKAAQSLALLGNKAAADELLEMYKKGVSGERQEALNSLSLLGDRRALQPMIELLVDEDRELVKKVQKNLAKWLGREPALAKEIVPILKKTEKPHQIVEIIHSLSGRMKVPEVASAVGSLTGHADALVRAVAVSALGGVPGREFLPLIIRGLDDKDIRVRKAAVSALGETGAPEAAGQIVRVMKERFNEAGLLGAQALAKLGPGAAPPVIPLLKEPEPRLREAAARALGDIGSGTAFEGLRAALGDAEHAVRLAAVTALGRIGDERAAPVLVGLLGDRDDETRETAAAALAEMGETAVDPLLKALRAGRPGLDTGAAVRILGEIGAPALPAIEKLFREGGGDTRILALRAIGLMPEEGTLPLVEGALRSKENPALRAEAARLLAGYGREALPLLIEALGDPDQGVRLSAVVSLGAIGKRRAEKPLLRLLAAEQGRARKAVVEALGRVGGRRAVGPLAGFLTGNDRELRLLAVEALGEMARPEATPHLAGLLGDRDPDIKRLAAESLTRIRGTSASGALVRLLVDPDPAFRNMAAGALAESGDRGAVGPLAGALSDADPAVRRNALFSLSLVLERVQEEVGLGLAEDRIAELVKYIGSPETILVNRAQQALELLGPAAVPKLIEAAGSNDPRMRLNAVTVLGSIRDKRAVPVLLAYLKEGTPPNLMNAAIWSLGRIGDAAALSPLVKKLKAKDSSTRGEAALALGLIRDQRAVGGLMTLLRDPVLKVRQDAQKALERLTGDKCPLLVFITPFPYIEHALFGLLVLLLAIWIVRKMVPAVNDRLRRIFGRITFFSRERFQWWVAVFLGTGAFALFSWSIYCQITKPGLEPVVPGYLVNLFLFTIKTYPFFIGGCLLSGVIMKLFSTKWRLPSSMLGACVLGAILPLCSCGVVPLTRAMLSLAIPLRTVIAFLVVTPVLNPFVIFLSWGVIGPTYTLLRIGGTFLLAIIMGLVIERFSGPAEEVGSSEICNFCKSCVSKDAKDTGSGLINGWRLILLLHPYIIIGLLLGASIAAWAPMTLVTKYLGSDILGLLLAVTIGVPLYLCTGEEVIFLKPLMDLGLPMGHAVAFTIAANGICITSIAVLFGVLGRRTTALLTFLFWSLSFILGYVINLIL